jgi:hypothetical protein
MQKVKQGLCPICGEKISHDGSGVHTTLVGYSSPSEHNHDDNCITKRYRCTNGHSFLLSKRNKCNKCNWVGKNKCECHDFDKLDEFPD